jgi:adenosylcobinamide-phosphate synthase
MLHGYELLAMLPLAVALDLALGEPPTWLHPTVWIGRTVSIADRLAPKSPKAGLAAGIVVVVLITGLWTAATFFLLDWLKGVHTVAYLLAGAAILKTTFSVKMLHSVAAGVRDLLVSGDMEQVRSRMSSLVSRDPSQLTPELATAAAIESVSENMCDSFIGPWLAFALFGVPGAVAYRAINTLDSMIGYHGHYEYLGKAAARLDDLVNLIPARISGALLVLASAMLPGQRAGGAWRIMWRDHGRTESPNAGWAMSGMAGALGVELEKVGHYRLGDPVRRLEPVDITRTIRSMYLVAGMSLAVALALTYLRMQYI